MKQIIAFMTIFFFAFSVIFPGYQAQETEAEKILKEGKQAYLEGNFEVAIDKLGLAIKKLENKEKLLDALITLSFIYHSIGDEANTGIYLKEVLRKNPRLNLNIDEYGPKFIDFLTQVKKDNLLKVVFKINPQGELFIDHDSFNKGSEIEVELMPGSYRVEVIEKNHENFYQDVVIDRTGQVIEVALTAAVEKPVIKEEPVKKEAAKPVKVIEKAGTKERKKKFPLFLVVAGVVVVGLILFLLLKKKPEDNTKYNLTVTLAEGVDGTPASGTYTYKKGEIVTYNYSVKSGFSDLSVKLDGISMAASGSITMNSNHTLEVASTKKKGVITGVTVEFKILFQATNIQINHHVKINDATRFNETLRHTQHYVANQSCSQMQNINRKFSVNTGPASFNIKHETSHEWDTIYSSESSAYCYPVYELIVTNYTYENGADPGAPTLSLSRFTMEVWPGDSSSDWIETQTITINTGATTSILNNPTECLDCRKPKIKKR